MIEIGQEFPNKKDRKRISLQVDWEKMLHGEYIFNQQFDQRTSKMRNVDPIVPIPAMLAEISSDLLFGEFPDLNFQNDQVNNVIKDYMKRFSLEIDLLEAAVSTSAVGTLFWKLFKSNNKTEYEFIQASKAVWEEEFGKLINIKFFEVVETSLNNKWAWINIQEHLLEPVLFMDEEVRNKYKIIEYKIKIDIIDNKIKEITNIFEVPMQMKLDFIPIIKIINIGQMGFKNGKSDYQGKEQLFAEIDNRVDQINHVLEEQTEPWTFVPPGILNQYGVFNRSKGKMVEKGVGGVDNSVDIITWDASLNAAFEQIKTLIKLVFVTSRISAPIAGIEDLSGGQSESGRALKWRSVNTFSMINRKRKYFNQAIRNFFNILIKFEEELKNVDVSNLVIKWQDGLPLDDTEVVENVVRQVQSGIMSKLTGIQKTQEIDKDRASTELDQINKEQGDEADIRQREIPITL
jgi:hypothetical protein